MKILKIIIIMLILIMSVGVVCAADIDSDDIISDDGQNDIYLASEDSFTKLADEIKNADDVLDLTHDYIFYNETDIKGGITIDKEDFVLNGNGHTIDGNNQSRIFTIFADNVTLKNLILINGYSNFYGAILTFNTLTLDNVTFINNYASEDGGAVGVDDATLNINNSKFIDNYANTGSSIYAEEGEVNICNTYISSKIFSKFGQIFLDAAEGNIENSIFSNIVSDYAPAVYSIESEALSVINSKFINLTASISAGAIGVKEVEEIYINNCEFINTTSSNNAGAILADIIGEECGDGDVTISNSIFKNVSSGFGGAYMQYGGNLVVDNSEFINNHAEYNGGSIYLSFVDNCEIDNCNFTSNGVGIFDDYPTYGGAIFSDISTLNIDNSNFINNTASVGNAVYAYDSSYNIKNSVFENNTQDIYTVFDEDSVLENNTYYNISTNNTFYATVVSGQGLDLTLINNTINVETVPKRFDLRDWGWTSPVRNQGFMGACWTFSMCGTLESALLKATGIVADFSENNMQNAMLQYSIYGGCEPEGGDNRYSAGYLLSWLGAFTLDFDVYDEIGKISPFITTDNDVHVQDVMFTPNMEIPAGTQLKLAIMNYGSIDVAYCSEIMSDDQIRYYNPDTYAQYVNDSSLEADHAVSIVGWDDNFQKEKFAITPPGDGAWIVKNSWDTDWGDNGFFYISYYDKSLLTSVNVDTYATSIIIENTEPYNKNYQYDIFWGGNFTSSNGNVSFYNVFEALENDAIAAVGTYFNQSGVNYTVEIFVNDELKLTQDGVSPYCGYHTIKLNEYVPIKEGDIFKAIVTSNGAPYTLIDETRVHYTENISFICYDGENWEDAYKNDFIVCLKVYTVALPIYTEDLVKIYKNDSKFEANVDVANETVTFEINGMNYTRTSDENGTARMAINLNPGNYTIKTTFNGTTVENKINVLPTLIADNLVKYFRNESQFYISLIDGVGNVVPNATITININGVFYNRTTNENGTAKLNINLNPGVYVLTAFDPLTGLQMSYNITVVPTLNAADLEMTYKDGSTFNVTVVDGQGKPLANAAVTFNINGILYTRYTNSDGLAKLNINLMAGEYIITSEYDELRISNTITIRD
ncbi:C1 family peptidase [Methanobrevibacter sp.]|uniref:C1 family peptidase n=1 Tax=Methanobrevibacter sp. TaxID=66852 RepID=UPI00388F564F